MKKALLLINLGTPDAADTASVRRYLREFLFDKRVIDLPAPLRALILYGFILPFRPKRSAHAYQAIWTKAGSPLLQNSLALQQKVQERIGGDRQVLLAMRYGKPSIVEALKTLQDFDDLIILPLYPQYSSAASGSSIEKVLQGLASQNRIPTLRVIRDFHNHPAFVKAEAELIAPYLQGFDHLLFSYHGLPERQLLQGSCQKLCQQGCSKQSSHYSACYRAQCLESSRLIAKALSLETNQYSVTFQSRLGKTAWIKPYTEEYLQELINRGIRRLVVASPSFVADCLETLEELGMRAQERWLSLGGEQFTLVPSLNDCADWVDAVLAIVQ